jgi:subtilase family serine protease
MKTKVGCALVVVLTACGGAVETGPSGETGSGASSSALTLPSQAAVPPFAVPSIPVCPGPAALGDARCHSHVVTDERGNPHAFSSYTSGLAPADLQAAYGVLFSGTSTTLTDGPTIAIVDAYDNPNAEADLGVYRTTFGLPPCTTANGCFKKINQRGGSKPPRGNSGWGLEIALDVQMASAICPTCRILLVEADSNSFKNLMAAVNQAASQGAVAISNSYGASEFSGETSYEGAYNHPGAAITVSSGDSGYGVEFPAASRYVTAVGGTTLQRSPSPRGWAETAWSGAGSGCSAYVGKPTWQNDPGCSRRTVADVSAVADPNTGVAVYDSYAYQGSKGWWVVGGTSASAPIVASVYALAALAGNATPVTDASGPYAKTSSLNDVTSGSNGSCAGTYLCTAVAGYDGPTGLGTPIGTGAF